MTFNYDNAIEALLKAVPEFEQSNDFKILKSSQNLPYVVYGSLNDYFEDLYTHNPESPLLTRVANFLELLATSRDPVLQDLLMTGFLENIYQSPCAQALGSETKKLAMSGSEH